MEPLLLVEDKPELRAMLRKALERAGYLVDEAADGSTAGVQASRSHHPFHTDHRVWLDRRGRGGDERRGI
jgi:DNA-binding response OmpR family regulator